jgi:hypothetical protein
LELAGVDTSEMPIRDVLARWKTYEASVGADEAKSQYEEAVISLAQDATELAEEASQLDHRFNELRTRLHRWTSVLRELTGPNPEPGTAKRLFDLSSSIEADCARVAAAEHGE